MNRKQKKAKRLKATAHTKQQGRIDLTPIELKYIKDYNNYKVLEAELIETDIESRAFIRKVKIAFWLIILFAIIYVI